MIRIIALSFVLCGLMLFSTAAWALNFKPGTYQVTTITKAPGMPAGAGKHTTTQCLTKQDPVPAQTSSGDCRVSKMETSGNTVSWQMECRQQGATMKGQGTMTYRGERFDGSFTMSMGPQAGNMTITSTISGKRVGPCP